MKISDGTFSLCDIYNFDFKGEMLDSVVLIPDH